MEKVQGHLAAALNALRHNAGTRALTATCAAAADDAATAEADATAAATETAAVSATAAAAADDTAAELAVCLFNEHYVVKPAGRGGGFAWHTDGAETAERPPRERRETGEIEAWHTGWARQHTRPSCL